MITIFRSEQRRTLGDWGPGGGGLFPLLQLTSTDKILPPLSPSTLSLHLSLHQLRHMRIFSVYCYKDGILSTLERIQTPEQ